MKLDREKPTTLPDKNAFKSIIPHHFRLVVNLAVSFSISVSDVAAHKSGSSSIPINVNIYSLNTRAHNSDDGVTGV